MENEENLDLKKILKRYYILFFITIILFIPCLFFCHLDEIITVNGEIRPKKNESSIKVMFSGIITKIYYENSKFVNKGDLLFEFNSFYEEQELLNLEKLRIIYQTEENELSNLLNLINETDINGLPSDAEIKYMDRKCSAFISECKRYLKLIEVSKGNYERNKYLFPVIISKSELEEFENSYYQDKYSFLSWLENQRIEVREKHSELIINLQNCEIQIMKKNRDISNSQVFAPISGYINEIIKIQEGEFVYEGTIILSIIPDTEQLQCIASIPSSNISKIKVGQESIIQITDLPWTKYGKLIGTVSIIPPDAIDSSNAKINKVFPVVIDIRQNYLQDRRKEKIFLHVGSTGKVSIRVSKNTVFQRFLERIILNEQ